MRAPTRPATGHTPAKPPTKAVLTLGKPRTGNFAYTGDRDAYAIQLEQGKAYKIAQDFAGLDDQWSVLDANGRTLADSWARFLVDTSAGGPTPITRFRAPYTGTFHIQPRTDESVGDYTIAVSLAAAAPPWNPKAGPTDDDDLLVLTNGPDVVDGLDWNDIIYGLAGDDRLKGSHGSDALAGGKGNDTLDGGESNDYLLGDEGDDRMIGGPDLDEAWGGAGRDVFDASVEAIHDFKPDEDRIDLHAVDTDPDKPGRQAFHFIGAKKPTQAGELGYVKDALRKTTALLGLIAGDDPDEPGIWITLDGLITLKAGNLTL